MQRHGRRICLDNLTQGSQGLSQFIDHTLLRPDACATEIEVCCQEAIDNNFFSVCIPPHYVCLAAKILKKSKIKICTVVGFPFGYNTTATKIFETKTAVDQGADEIDMVMNITALKSGDEELVLDDIQSVVRAANGRTVKVILETCYLTKEEKILACRLSLEGGAHFVKTSTGFGTAGATTDDIDLMVRAVGGKMGIKASDGIRNTEVALKMIKHGATRLGSSQSLNIVRGVKSTNESTY